MHHFVKSTALSIIFLSAGSNAFVAPSGMLASSYAFSASGRTLAQKPQQSCAKLYASSEESDEKDDEIERLKTMAAKLRAEASALEAEKAQQLADAAEKAFRKFDTNEDGEISLEELKKGLEKVLKTELSEGRVKRLMDAFDTSGDGALQLDEFVGIDKFRNQLEALARDEKEAAIQAAKAAKEEAEAAILAEARLAILNEKPPTNTDKLLSILPYLFPLLDGLQFGRFLLQGEDNPVVNAIAILFTLYRSIPLGGFIAFLALNFLSGNPSLNRLVRFNLQQAIFVDIALFFPGLVFAVYSLLSSSLGLQIPAEATELGTDAIFVTLMLTLAYCTVSSLLGIAPDKLPFISQVVNDRMPTLDMFDDQGRFRPRLPEDEDKKDDK